MNGPLAFTSIYFNIPLCILSDTSNVDESINEIKKNKITSIFATPSFFSQFNLNNLLNKFKKTKLRRILSGGDFFPSLHIYEWKKLLPNISILNVWGPTETSIVNSMHLITSKDFKDLKSNKLISIGRSTKRMQISLINKRGLINKSNTKGEICVTGTSICKGYFNNLKKYNQSLRTIGKKTYFKTGDEGYFDGNKKLFITGRKDNTIKISGYRVDLKEIENYTNSYKNVFISACFSKKINENIKELRILIQRKNLKIDFDIYKYKVFLRDNLVFYKIPKKIILIDNMILNNNGKLDRTKIKETY